MPIRDEIGAKRRRHRCQITPRNSNAQDHRAIGLSRECQRWRTPVGTASPVGTLGRTLDSSPLEDRDGNRIRATVSPICHVHAQTLPTASRLPSRPTRRSTPAGLSATLGVPPFARDANSIDTEKKGAPTTRAPDSLGRKRPIIGLGGILTPRGARVKWGVLHGQPRPRPIPLLSAWRTCRPAVGLTALAPPLHADAESYWLRGRLKSRRLTRAVRVSRHEIAHPVHRLGANVVALP